MFVSFLHLVREEPEKSENQKAAEELWAVVQCFVTLLVTSAGRNPKTPLGIDEVGDICLTSVCPGPQAVSSASSGLLLPPHPTPACRLLLLPVLHSSTHERSFVRPTPQPSVFTLASSPSCLCLSHSSPLRGEVGKSLKKGVLPT